MPGREHGRVVALVLFCGLSLAEARADVAQTLDSVDAISTRRVLEMRFGDQPQPLPTDPGYESVDAASLTNASESFLACQRAANRDLYCLLNSYTGADGKLTQPVRRWSESGSTQDLFSCTDPSLGLDRRRANPCTSLTVDLAGNLWLGGRNGTTHSVLKVVEVGPGGSCSASPLPAGDKFLKIGDLTGSSDFCFRPYASGRPVLVDMTAIDPRIGKDFQVQPGNYGGAGVLLLEDRKTGVFLADPVDADTGVMLDPLPPVEIASGKSGWNLVGNETVQSLSLLQLDCTGTGCADPKLNYVLATTSTGKVMAKRTDPLGAAEPVFQSPTPASCGSSATPQYWIRVSPQSGAVYLSDRNCAVVRQFDVTANTPALTLTATLSTSPAATSTSGSLSTISVSPGIGFNLNKCLTTKCILSPNGSDTRNEVGAYITGVDIDPAGQSGLAVFRITGIPDCRYPPHRVAADFDYPANPNAYAGNPTGVCATLPDHGIVDIGGRKYLNVAGLLPLEVQSLFNDSTQPTLDDLELLIGPQYRARPSTDPATTNTFEAFFGRSEDGSTGVVFRDTFDLKFDIGQLTQTNVSRCGYLNTDQSQRNPEQWDAIVTVSERTPVVDSSNGTAAAPAGLPRHVETLTNTFCENPTSGAGVRWSLYAYGLMLTDTSPKAFLNLVRGLYDDLERARVLTACRNYTYVDADGILRKENANQPLSPSVCSGLATDWLNGLDKLNKCITAATDPKTSAADQNCQSFVSQVKGYRSRVATANLNWFGDSSIIPDKANRRGELEARVDVILHIFSDQFLPSIPLGGFPPP